MKIYLVEELYNEIGVESTDSTIQIICSTEPLARRYCENYDSKDKGCSKSYWWWLIIYEYEVDNELHCEIVAVYDWHGKEIKGPPRDGYTEEFK